MSHIHNTVWTAAITIGMRVYYACVYIHGWRLTRGPGYPYAAMRWMKIYRERLSHFLSVNSRAQLSLRQNAHTHTTTHTDGHTHTIKQKHTHTHIHVHLNAWNRIETEDAAVNQSAEECVPRTHSTHMLVPRYRVNTSAYYKCTVNSSQRILLF